MVEIIEHLRGVDFRQALRTHVLDPIGLDSFLLGPDAATQAHSLQPVCALHQAGS